MGGGTLLILGQTVKGQDTLSVIKGGQLWHSWNKTLSNHFQTSRVNCWWWEEESYWFWVKSQGHSTGIHFNITSKTLWAQTTVFVQSLSNFISKVVGDGSRNPIDLGHFGTLSVKMSSCLMGNEFIFKHSCFLDPRSQIPSIRVYAISGTGKKKEDHVWYVNVFHLFCMLIYWINKV